MKIPKETLKIMGIAGNVFDAADMGKTVYDVCKGKKSAGEIVKKASKPVVGLMVKRALTAVGVGTGVVGMVAGFAIGTAVDIAIDYTCNK